MAADHQTGFYLQKLVIILVNLIEHACFSKSLNMIQGVYNISIVLHTYDIDMCIYLYQKGSSIPTTLLVTNIINSNDFTYLIVNYNQLHP